MNKSHKILIISAVIFFFLAGVFVAINFSNLRGSGSERIEITQLKKEYQANESIVVAGLAPKNSKISILWSGRFGLTQSDDRGNWIVNLGKMPAGKYDLQAIADDVSGVRSIATAQVSVVTKPGAMSFVSKMSSFLNASLSLNQEKVPDELITVPRNLPPALNGEWNLLE